MLTKRTIRKILVSTCALFALFLIYIIPNDQIKDLKDASQELEYVNKNAITSDIYLLNNHNLLTKTSVVVDTNDSLRKARQLIDILIKDGAGENRIPSGFTTFIPSETKLLSSKFDNGVLKLNFSKDLLKVNAEYEEKVIESLVYTLTSIPDVKYIIIYIDDDVLTTLPQSKKNLPPTFDRSFGINKIYEIQTLENINQVTIYYIDKYNDNYYYVPVTKYVNDDREKIKIIIDELTSSPIYNTNLMSFLNSNAKLLSVEQTADKIDLTFNSYIFNNMDEKKILEEVIYSICLSIKDNYNVKEVGIHVGNEEIYKTVLKTLE